MAKENLVGMVFNELTVIEQVEFEGKGRLWRCKCSCGKETTATTSDLKSGHKKSCGHLLKGRRKNLIGQRFGRLVVIAEGERGNRYWKCQCDCGNIKEINENSFLKGATQSCGCLHKERVKAALTENLVGQRFGRLVALCLDTENKSKKVKWICQCDCGVVKSVPAQTLKTGTARSCGCLKKETTSKILSMQIAGKKFGRLTVLERSGSFQGSDGAKYSTWLCQCDCGNTTIVRGHDLVRGSVSSCGCLISKGEEFIRKILVKYQINFETQASYSDFKSESGRKYRFDFKIYNSDKSDYFLLEYQGVQHDKKYEKYNIDFGKQQREITDRLKKEYCNLHNIKLYEIWYYDDIEAKLKELLIKTNYMPILCQASSKEEG